MPTEKLFETSIPTPSVRIVSKTFSDTPHVYVRCEERGREQWNIRGLLDLSPYHPPVKKGAFQSPCIAAWGETQFHANGDRVRVDGRLRSIVDGDTLRLIHEERREEVLGFGTREEHDWQAAESWSVSAGGGD